jgi:hypothetical protein
MQKIWYKWMRDASLSPITFGEIICHAKPVTPGLRLRTRNGVVLGSYIPYANVHQPSPATPDVRAP